MYFNKYCRDVAPDNKMKIRLIIYDSLQYNLLLALPPTDKTFNIYMYSRCYLPNIP